MKHFLLRCAFAAIGLFALAATANSATFTVTKVADTNDGVCDSDCSLRRATYNAHVAFGPNIANRAGSHDPLFGPDGIVVTALGANDPESGSAVVIQGDGKIVVAGRKSPYSGSRDGVIIRYNSDGSLDPSFGSAGVVIMPFTQGNSFEDVAIQPDGKIVVVGSIAHGVTPTSGSDFFIARFDVNGSLDATFNSTGFVFTDFNGTSDEAFALAIQLDGKIVVGGYATPGGSWKDYAFARYLSDGSLDPGFGTAGKFQQSGNTWSGDDIVMDLMLQTDGKIVGVGETNGSGSSNFVAGLIRIHGNGTLDQTFGTGGFVKTGFGGPSYAKAGELMSDGRIVIAGVRSSFSDNVAVVRYLPSGGLDLSFSGDGIVTTAVGSQAYGTDLKLLDDGRVLVGGFSNTSFLLIRYGIDGEPDESFGVGGVKVQSAGGFDDRATSLALSQDGKFFAVGTSGQQMSDRDVALLRFNSNGSLDTSFGPIGRVHSSFSNFYDVAHDIKPTPDNKILVAGTISVGTSGSRNITVARYLPNGSLDTTFGGTGFANILVGFSSDAIARVAVQPDGKVVVAGYGTVSGQRQTILARFNQNGSNDTTFGSNGKVTLGGNSVAVNHQMNDMVLMPDGRIVLGYTVPDGTRERMAVIRINKNGVPDEAFGSAGRTVLPLTSGNERTRSIALNPEGRLTIAGEIEPTGGTPTVGIARINWDGSLDMTFATDGYITPDLGPVRTDRLALGLSATGHIVLAAGSTDNLIILRLRSNGVLDGHFGSAGISVIVLNGSDPKPRDLVVQPNGKILIAGASQENSDTDFLVARVHASGGLDTSFGNGGTFVPELGELEEEFYGIGLRENGNIVLAGTQIDVARRTFVVYSLLGDRLAVPFDFDGDGRSDVSVYRPSDGKWYVYGSQAGFIEATWGTATDTIAPADFDGDGKTDFAVFRDGVWLTYQSSGNVTEVPWGAPGDKPVPADYDGDGRADQAVYRDGVWWIYRSTEGPMGIQWGSPTDIPVPADYDGDGKADVAVVRDGVWWILQSSLGATGIQWGQAGDKPAPADYDGDGKADVAVVRDGTWWIFQSTAGPTGVAWGTGADIPVPADYDGDGKSDIAIFREGMWWIYQSTLGPTGAPWGVATDVPVPRQQ